MMAKDTFLEFVEKNVIIDLISDPFIHKNFIEYKSFPYDEKSFMGHETAMMNVFTFWQHYVDKYLKQIKDKVRLLDEQYLDYEKREGKILKSS